MNINLHQLRIFVAVARLGNFTRAAERLHLSQPSLSLHVGQLEVDFGLGAIDGVDADIFGSPLISDELIAVFPRVHPLANATTTAVKTTSAGKTTSGLKTTSAVKTTWRALAKHPFVAMSRDSSVRRLTEQAFAHNGLVLEPAFEAKYMSTALGMIAHGLGIGALPSSAASMARQ